MTRFEGEHIRDYYDRNTPAFVTFGQGGGAIHRAVWGPGVGNRDDAFHYVDDRIAALIQTDATRSPHVVDLGCGVGASLCHLAKRLPIRGTGVTLSPVQARLARERIREQGLGDRVVCIEADFTSLPPHVEPADLAYAIESFVHGPDPQTFFGQCNRLLRPNGMLVICDDFVRPGADRAAGRTLARFSRGWHVNTLVDSDEIRATARHHGFEHVSTTNLTPYLELRRARDRIIDAAVALFGWLPLDNTRLGPLIGGSALQKSLRKGWIEYHLVVFRRT